MRRSAGKPRCPCQDYKWSESPAKKGKPHLHLWFFTVWGGRSWVPSHLETLLRTQARDVHMATVRMEDCYGVKKELELIKPSHVFNCVVPRYGRTLSTVR